MSAGHIRQRSGGSFEIRWRAAGKVCTRTVRGSKRDAQQALRAALSAVDRGEHVAPSKTTVAAFVAERIETWPGSARTREHYRELAALIEPHLGEVQIQKLTTLQVENWHAALRARVSGNVVRHAHNLLSRALADGVRHGLVARNVAAMQKPPKVEREEVEIIPADEIQPTLAKLVGDPFYPAVIVALYCGLRRGEQLALTWTSVDLGAKVIRVRAALEETKAHGLRVKQPKTRAGRRDVSLPDIVVTALREHRRQQLERRLLLGLGRPASDSLVVPGR